MSFDTAVNVFAVIGVAAVIWVAIQLVGRFLGWVERSEIERQRQEALAEAAARPDAPARSAPEPEGVPADHVAAIAAAVAAFGDGLKVVHIEDYASGHAWANEGRWAQQISHQPVHR